VAEERQALDRYISADAQQRTATPEDAAVQEQRRQRFDDAKNNWDRACAATTAHLLTHRQSQP
jgi:hypothetical protein